MNELLTRALTATFLGVSAAFLLLYAPLLLGLVALLGLGMVILIIEWPHFKLWWLTPWYPIVPFLALIDLYIRHKYLLLLFLVLVAAYDSGAYIGGRYLGSLRIAPRISPGKTVEGLLAGILCSVAVSFVSIFFLQKPFTYGIIITVLLSICVALLAFLGDLFESYLKRCAHLKDAGFLLPGHGGFLDRIDGLLLVCIVFDIFFIALGLL